MKVDKHLFQALAQFWNTAYSCFTFGKVALVPTVEEYTALLRCLRYNSSTPRYEEEGRCLFFECIRLSCLP
ncbi:hypothetical protein Gotri_027284 [Gossypium trilobum]|uniref:DUF7745 domain-containing protein n=1 Tax=Gossypium trilobum TaxID=34281 RepID=A0A7J9FTX8_9ROSI|nr:hypothetical protein [Gossypium trilobum]